MADNPQPGVPTGDQRPTNDDGDRNIVADVHIPGPYPSDQEDSTGEPLSSEPEPTKESREVTSLGEEIHGPGTPAMVTPEAVGATRDAVGEDSSTKYDDPRYIPESPDEEAEKLRAESYPGGVPEDADVGTGRRKGQGLPPGSVGRGQDTPQTPAT